MNRPEASQTGNGFTILTVIETSREIGISPMSLECLAYGAKLAGESRGRSLVLIMGSALGPVAEDLRYYNIDAVHVVDDPLLEQYQCDYYVSAFEQALQGIDSDLILLGNTVTHLDLAPRLAFRMDLPLITDCTEIEVVDGKPVLTKPVFSGNVIATYEPSSTPCIATLRKSAIEPAPRQEEPSGGVKAHDVHIEIPSARTQVIESGLEAGEGSQIDEAEVVVAGGRGMGGPEGFELLRKLSAQLGAAIGASRPPCDLGWVSSDAQVGQTGAIIAPDLYIAVGISGSMQHIAGMSRSKVVVAINKDPKASIFSMADYGVVGEFEEVIPAFIESLGK